MWLCGTVVGDEWRFVMAGRGSLVAAQRFEEEIGRGGFGVVYRAENLVTHELVAIKRFSLRHVEDNLASIQVSRTAGCVSVAVTVSFPLVGTRALRLRVARRHQLWRERARRRCHCEKLFWGHVIVGVW